MGSARCWQRKQQKESGSCIASQAEHNEGYSRISDYRDSCCATTLGFPSSNTSPQTKALSGKEIKSAPVHQVNHLNKLTVGVTGCFNLGDDDERGRVEVCKADAHSMINGQRIDLSLTCFLSWATCVRLTSNEDYYFEVVSGLPECQNFEKIHMTCIKIHARPYDAIYINTKREKR